MNDLAHTSHLTPPSIELMLDYLEGNLSRDEAAAVRQRIEQEPFYQEALASLRQALEEDPAGTRDRAQRYRDLMREQFNRPRVTAPPAPQAGWRFPRWQVAAATVLLLLLPALYLWQRPPLEQRLVAQHLQPAHVLTLRSGKTEASQYDPWAGAVRAYGDKAYPEAITQFEAFLGAPEATTNAVKQQQARLYLGVSYLLAQQPAAAIAPLQSLLDQSRSELQDEARWYLAWAYLQENRRTEALELFSLLAQKPNPHQEAAQEVWEALRPSDD